MAKNPSLWATFLFSTSVTIISLIPAVFPALYASFSNTNNLAGIGITGIPVDYLEIGISAGPVIVTSLAILVLGILYWKKIFPKQFKKAIEFVFEFEVSKKIATIVVLAIMAIYIGASAHELTEPPSGGDWDAVEERLLGWSLDSIYGFDVHVNYFLLNASKSLFDNYKIIPFITSIGLLLTIFFITKKITEKRFAGIAALVVTLQSNIFLTYDSDASYTNFWILFYLLSLYLIYKIWPLAHGSFLLSIPSKALTVTFFPMSLYFMACAQMPRRKKILVIVTFAGILAAGFVAISSSEDSMKFDAAYFWQGFASFAAQARFDLIIMSFLLPLIFGLFFVSRNGLKQAESILFILGWLLLLAPVLDGFTGQQTQPYRLMPLVVFFAIGTGALLGRSKGA